jgi:predicted  nucleic acid-binding Zn-ribbon protein
MSDSDPARQGKGKGKGKGTVFIRKEVCKGCSY